jgi:hypothetical protein
MFCECEISQEGQELKLVANCRSCKHGKADLSDPVCFGGILRAFSQGLGAHVIVLSRPVEVQYDGRTIGIFERSVELLELMENLGLRDPVTRYSKTGEKGLARYCSRCDLNPSVVFPKLREILYNGPEAFHGAFKEVVARAATPKEETGACNGCVRETRDDLTLLFNKFEEFVRHVVKQGFSIVF